ncbi:MAG TPA: hypothetical protein VJ779_05720 [Acetobacteraceae bacterium]|nr:hypothetical protein [Acetobacteraceae bacterium]
MPETIAEIDGVVFRGRFAGFAQPLEVALPDGETVLLRPWPYHAHIAALSESLFAGEAGLMLDAPYFASRVLSWSGVPSARLAALAPLALWWAAGGEDEKGAEPGDLGSSCVTLRPWSERERLAALLAARQAGTFDAPAYLDRMVRASVAGFTPAARLEDIDSLATARLLDAVVALNAPDLAADPLLGGGAEAAEAARAILSLCRALGWTPAQILAAPAVEIDRMRHLLMLAEPARAPRQLSRPRLADRPDAVVIQFEDAP